MRTDQYLILAVCCSLISACGLTTHLLERRVPLEPVAELPAQWNATVSDRLDEFGCPILAGRYALPPEVVETAVGRAYAKRREAYRDQVGTTGSPLHHFSLFIGPLRGEHVDSSESDREPFLALDRAEPDAITLRALAPGSVKKVTYRLPIEASGLRCVDGYFQLPTYEHYAVGEFTTLNLQQFRRFGTLSDGSLVYYEQFGPLKQLADSKGEFTHRFYRFRPRKNAGEGSD